MDVQPGQVFGGYRLTRRLGGGQLGQVYEAQQERTERWVALRLVDKMLTYGTEAQRRLLEGLKGVNRLALPALRDAHGIAAVPAIAFRRGFGPKKTPFAAFEPLRPLAPALFAARDLA